MRGETWALLIAALVPALTAITWVAYRHPIAYARMWMPGLIVLIGFALTAGWAYNAGVASGIAADPDADPRIPLAVVFGVLPLIMIYVLFLRFLPRLLPEQAGTPTTRRR